MPASETVSVRLDDETARSVKELARRTSRSVSSVIAELVVEAVRARQHPGIAFAGPPGDRRARVEGTGLDVWEVVAAYRGCGEDRETALRQLEHLLPRHLEAALGYYARHQEETDLLIAENERPPEEWTSLYPHLSTTR